MLLSDIFSIPFLICLAICILLIGCSSIYFYQRIMQQDHKIASMVSLLSSMAEEPTTSSFSSSCAAATVVPSFGGQPQQQQQQHQSMQKLIAVSDDEDSESSSDDYDDDNSDYSETSSENDGEEHILSAVDFDELTTDLENSITIVEEPVLEEEETHMEELNETESSIKSIHLDTEATDFSIFKSINITDDIHPPEETSYKKMTLQKLREIAQQNGHADVSKLKKPELLKLLEAE